MSAIKNNFTHLKTNHENIPNLVITISVAFFSLFDLEWKVITKDMDTKRNKAVVTNAAYLQKGCIFFTYDYHKICIYIYLLWGHLYFHLLAVFSLLLISASFHWALGFLSITPLLYSFRGGIWIKSITIHLSKDLKYLWQSTKQCL